MQSPAMAARSRLKPILFQNADHDITLIDIPASIMAAQGGYVADQMTLISSAPLHVPYDGCDPRSAASDGSILNPLKRRNTTDAYDHASLYKPLIEMALAEIARSDAEVWCLPRTLQSVPDPVDKPLSPLQDALKKLDAAGERLPLKPIIDDALLFQRLVALESPCKRINMEMKQESHESDNADGLEEDWSASFHNPHSSTLRMKCEFAAITSNDYDSNGGVGTSQPVVFYTPPHSTFTLADCRFPDLFRTAIRNLSQEYDDHLSRRFNFILLDPPWPNASAKRKRKHRDSATASYQTVFSVHEMRRLLLRMDLDTYIAEDGVVGVWITNKPAIRELVLGEDGLFAHWGVELFEEWIWAKVTAEGECIVPLDGEWRKPYEILLLGRARSWQLKQVGAGVDASVSDGIRHRVIVAVPDMHSRKPCLKTLIEPLLSSCDGGNGMTSHSYNALEIFARNLVQGWWSWGNEVLKFNRDAHWVSRGASPAKGETVRDEGQKQTT